MTFNSGFTERDEAPLLLRVRINMDCAPSGLHLLTPGGGLQIGRCRFELNPEVEGHADFAVTLYNARPYDRFVCAPQNTLLIVGEPLAKKVYPKSYYRQFGHLVDTHTNSGHPNLQVSAPGLNWHVGLDRNGYQYGYDALQTMVKPEKQNKIAVVCSNAQRTEGQRQRLQLLEALKRRLGDRLVHFGRGFEPIDDKMAAILPYRFHLVLENCVLPNYWTEKLADALLGWAYPVYLGCPNIDRFLPENSVLSINDLDADSVVRQITDLLDAPLSSLRSAALSEARRRVLDVYNPFAWSAAWAERLYRAGLPEKRLLQRSHKAFRSFPRGHLYRIRQALA